jgi:hypothetical protein
VRVIKSYVNRKKLLRSRDYYKGEGSWVASIAENYFKDLEIYIAGDVNELNPTLEKQQFAFLTTLVP